MNTSKSQIEAALVAGLHRPETMADPISVATLTSQWQLHLCSYLGKSHLRITQERNGVEQLTTHLHVSLGSGFLAHIRVESSAKDVLVKGRLLRAAEGIALEDSPEAAIKANILYTVSPLNVDRVHPQGQNLLGFFRAVPSLKSFTRTSFAATAAEAVARVAAELSSVGLQHQGLSPDDADTASIESYAPGLASTVLARFVKEHREEHFHV